MLRKCWSRAGGRGIGRAIALRFAREGAWVAVAARTSPEVDAVAKEVERAGGRGLAAQMNVRDFGSVEAAVYRSVTNPYVDRYLRAQRKDLYPDGLFGRGNVGDHGDDQKTARAIMDFVRRGGRLGLVCDLYDRTGMPVPFFGKEAKTQAIAAMIARRVGARIWLSRVKRLGKQSRFEIELKELRVPRTANQAEDIRWTMAHMQEEFEAWIREAPEQWMWSNRRWS